MSAEHGRDSQAKKSPLEGGVEVRAWQLANVYGKARRVAGLLAYSRIVRISASNSLKRLVKRAAAAPLITR